MKTFGEYGLTTVEAVGVALARHTILGRGRARHLVERIFLPPRETPRDALIWSGKAKLRLPPKSSLKYLTSDLHYNSAEREYLRRTIREGDVIADIGANIGFYTLWIAALGVPRTKVIAFEPNPSVYDALVENVRLNAFDNVILVNAAVGEKDGTASFGITADKPSVGSVLAKRAQQVAVSMRTLASVLEERGLHSCDILKIDVEGYEDQALIPYLESTPIERWPRLLIIEHKHHAKYESGNPIDILIRNGYRAPVKTRGNIVLEKA